QLRRGLLRADRRGLLRRAVGDDDVLAALVDEDRARRVEERLRALVLDRHHLGVGAAEDEQADVTDLAALRLLALLLAAHRLLLLALLAAHRLPALLLALHLAHHALALALVVADLADELEIVLTHLALEL